MKRIILSVFFVFMFMTTVFSQTSEADASDIANKIVDLAKSTKWPAGAGPVNGAPVKICLVGDTPVKGELEKLATTTSVAIEITTATDNLSAYHIVYNPSSELSSLAAVLKQVGSAKTLTVSSAKDFARYGVMVNLLKETGKSEITYEINTMVLDGAGIKLDPNIIKKATKI